MPPLISIRPVPSLLFLAFRRHEPILYKPQYPFSVLQERQYVDEFFHIFVTFFRSLHIALHTVRIYHVNPPTWTRRFPLRRRTVHADHPMRLSFTASIISSGMPRCCTGKRYPGVGNRCLQKAPNRRRIESKAGKKSVRLLRHIVIHHQFKSCQDLRSALPHLLNPFYYITSKLPHEAWRLSAMLSSKYSPILHSSSQTFVIQ